MKDFVKVIVELVMKVVGIKQDEDNQAEKPVGCARISCKVSGKGYPETDG